jgi:hypothetical protein
MYVKCHLHPPNNRWIRRWVVYSFVRSKEWLISSSLNSVNLYVESCNYFSISALTILKQKKSLTFLDLKKENYSRISDGNVLYRLWNRILSSRTNLFFNFLNRSKLLYYLN